MNSEEISAEMEAHRKMADASKILYQTSERMGEAGIGPHLAITGMFSTAFRHADQLTPNQQASVLRMLDTFIDERCQILEAAGQDMSRYDDLRRTMQLEELESPYSKPT